MTKTATACGECGAQVDAPTDLGLAGVYAELAAHLTPLCTGCAAAIETAYAEEERQEKARLLADRLKVRVVASGLPAKYHGSAVDDLDRPADVLDAARRWAVDGGGLLLSGDVGRGKTTLAGAAAWLRLQTARVLWTSAPLVFARLGSGFGTEQRDWALEVLAGKHALVLDDIDKTRPTEYGAEQVFLAIDQRVEHEAPLLVTSNLAPSQLAEKWPAPYGDAIASRLVGYCRVFRIEGVDRRLAGDR